MNLNEAGKYIGAQVVYRHPKGTDHVPTRQTGAIKGRTSVYVLVEYPSGRVMAVPANCLELTG